VFDGLITWGNIFIDGSGKIEAHVAENLFATIRIDHVRRIMSLRTDLFDLFIKHFSTKPLTRELLKLRDYYESNVDSILAHLADFRKKGDTQNFSSMLYWFTLHTTLLAREGVEEPSDIRGKIYSAIWGE
jgi:hypothetical protein